MPKTPEEKIAWQRQAYGCTEEAMNKDIENSIMDPRMIAMSILSDAQECIEQDLSERARQLINQVKYVIDTRLNNN